MRVQQFLTELKTCDGDKALDLIEGYQTGKVKLTDFNEWWENVGSGIPFRNGEDIEEHTRLVCKMFYQFITQEVDKFNDE